MLGVHWFDIVVIVVYLLGITFIGVWSVRRVKTAASFFIGERKFGKILMMFFTFGTGTHSDQAVSVAAKTYRSGASGIWYQWLWLFVTPFFWILAPMFRRMRAVTTSDYFEARYNRSVSVLFAILGTLQLMVNIGLMLKASSAMITAVTGGQINPDYAIAGMTAIDIDARLEKLADNLGLKNSEMTIKHRDFQVNINLNVIMESDKVADAIIETRKVVARET